MNWRDLTLRVGILAVLTAMLLRFAGSGIFGNATGIFSQPELASFLIYSETGRRPVLPSETKAETEKPSDPGNPSEPAPTVPAPTVPAVPELPVFRATDMQYVKISNSTSYEPDAQKLLLQKLEWDLTGDEPTILIIHSHGTEAYTKTADSMYDNYAAYRTMDDRYNMISIGDELTRLLEEQGLSVIHDRTAHDYLDYDNAYENSRKAVQAYLKEYPTIKMVLDLHRDAATNADGSQWATSATVDGKPSAQLMLVVGTDALGETHSGWRTNLSIAEKLNVLMAREEPGICRPIRLKSKRYNHDLAKGALIVEVGTAGNTHDEAMNAIPVLAEAIAALAQGTE